jgi:hypothetical protein
MPVVGDGCWWVAMAVFCDAMRAIYLRVTLPWTRQAAARWSRQEPTRVRRVTGLVRDDDIQYTHSRATHCRGWWWCSQAYRRVLGEAWGADAENDSRAQRNTEKVDPSTNRRSVCEGTAMLRLMLQPGVVMGGRCRAWCGENGSEEAADASEGRRGRAVQRSSCQAVR